MFSRKLTIILLSVFLITSFLVFLPTDSVLAQGAVDNIRAKFKTADDGDCGDGYIKLQIPIPGFGNCVNADVGFPAYLAAFYSFFTGAIGIIVVVMIMIGGMQWILAAGNQQRIANAKTTIFSAVAGLVLVLLSYTLLQFINPRLTNLRLTQPTKIDPKAFVTQWASAPFCYDDHNNTGDKAFKNTKCENIKCGEKCEVIKQTGAKKEALACKGSVCSSSDLGCFQIGEGSNNDTGYVCITEYCKGLYGENIKVYEVSGTVSKSCNNPDICGRGFRDLLTNFESTLIETTDGKTFQCCNCSKE